MTASFAADERAVVGVDGCRAGWILVMGRPGTRDFCHALLKSFGDVIAFAESAAVLAVDMPIGLHEAAEVGGRECDRVAREFLGERGCCVFSPPVRAALRCATYDLARAENSKSSPARIGLSRQAFGLFPKLLDVDECMSPQLQDRVFEVHPELSFYEMNGQRAMTERKKSSSGFSQRRSLLERAGFGNVIEVMLRGYPRKDVGRDDVVDACVACWTAERIRKENAIRVPEVRLVDARGLRMEIWR
ncbi:MAG TPA: DUF429 domain-containing protein [Terriglobales bacterium]|nr:DUF429 domain-containing protein [Terriglobales bacterium]